LEQGEGEARHGATEEGPDHVEGGDLETVEEEGADGDGLEDAVVVLEAPVAGDEGGRILEGLADVLEGGAGHPEEGEHHEKRDHGEQCIAQAREDVAAHESFHQ
jgi:hypothetical protein